MEECILSEVMSRGVDGVVLNGAASSNDVLMCPVRVLCVEERTTVWQGRRYGTERGGNGHGGRQCG